jgi:ribosomal protein S18 acetylase RimI-like enzyme
MSSDVAEITVRDASDDDFQAVASVLRAANREFAPMAPSGWYRSYLAAVLDIGGRAANAQVLIAEYRSRIVGTITLYPDASQQGWGWPEAWAGIRAVGVEPPARRRGIGRLLTEECISRAGALGAEAVCLHTAPFMPAATAMYESVGFRRAPRFDRDAAELLGAPGSTRPILALAYQLDLDRQPGRPSLGERAPKSVSHTNAGGLPK